MHIPTLLRRLTVLPLCLAAFATADAAAQQVYLSEVRTDSGDAWVEIHNRGTTPMPLASWSLHYSTHTPGEPRQYWWAFPNDAVLQPDGYLRVFWYQSAPGTPAPGDYYTGTSVYGFLFGLGGEELRGDAGALALFRTQQGAGVIDPINLVDWVSWGVGGFAREPLAIAAGLWTTDDVAPAIGAGQSIARNIAQMDSVAAPYQAWFVDHTPTPMGPNVTGALAETYGTACTLPGNHLLGTPALTASSEPLIGDAQFHLRLGNTTGLFGEFVLIGISAGAAPPGLPSILPAYSGVGCHEAIDPFQFVATWIVPAQLMETTVPLPLHGLSPGAAGVELHVQALVIDLLANSYPPYQGLSNALRLVLGQ